MRGEDNDDARGGNEPHQGELDRTENHSHLGRLRTLSEAAACFGGSERESPIKVRSANKGGNHHNDPLEEPLLANRDDREGGNLHSNENEPGQGEEIPSLWTLLKGDPALVVLGIVGVVDAIEYGAIMPSLSAYLTEIEGGSCFRGLLTRYVNVNWDN